MHALLLSAGLGTRLRPVTNTIPKCLVPIAGRPLMSYWLELLFANGVERVLINTHYMAEKVQEYVANCPWHDRITLVHEDELLGTGGTVLNNEQFFGAKTFFVAHADNLVSFDFAGFCNAHHNSNKYNQTPITMMTFETDTPQACGIVESDENDIVIAFHEKVAHPPGKRANGAIYIFEPDILEFLKSLNKDVIDISTEVLPLFMGRIATYHNDIYLRDIGTVKSLKQAEYDVQNGLYDTNKYNTELRGQNYAIR
ncbi:MAG: nucleotidyltransferase family protein [Pseudomonadota bacterium]